MALPFWNLREVRENKHSFPSWEGRSSEPVDGFHLPISKLLNCLMTRIKIVHATQSFQDIKVTFLKSRILSLKRHF